MIQRRHARFSCHVDVKLQTQVGHIAGHTVDSSRGGVCLTVDVPLPVASVLDVMLTLVLEGGGVSEPLMLPARVVWCTTLRGAHQVGCAFFELAAQETQYLEMFL